MRIRLDSIKKYIYYIRKSENLQRPILLLYYYSYYNDCCPLTTIAFDTTCILSCIDVLSSSTSRPVSRLELR